MSCIRDERGRVENFVSQIADITAAVEANERNALLNQRITEELHTAAAYVESILPRGLTGGGQRVLAIPAVPGVGWRLLRLPVGR